MSAGGVPERPYDLTTFIDSDRYDIEIRPRVTPSERTAKTRISEEDARHQRWIEKLATSVALGVLAVIVIGSLLFIAFSSDADKVKGAFALLSGAASGCVGYALGRGHRPR